MIYVRNDADVADTLFVVHELHYFAYLSEPWHYCVSPADNPFFLHTVFSQ